MPAREVRRLRDTLEQARRQVRRASRLDALAIVLFGAVFALFAGTLAAWAGLSPLGLLILEIGGLLATVTFAAVRYLRIKKRALDSDVGAADWLDRLLAEERTHPPVAFRSAMELIRDRGRFDESKVLTDEAVTRAANFASTLNPRALVRRRTRPELQSKSTALGVSVIALVVVALVLPASFRSALTVVSSLGALEEALIPRVPEPRLGDIRLTYRYPGYAKRAPRTVRSLSGDIRALPGTEVTIETHSYQPFAQAALLITQGDDQENAQRVAIEVNGRQLRATLVVNRAGRYRISAQGKGGERLEQRRGGAIQLDLDAVPEVTLSQPEETPLEVNEKDTVKLEFSAEDDFGLGDIRVAWRVLGSAREGTVPLTSSARGKRRHKSEATLNLEDLQLKPGDRVAYTIEALDNDTVNGPKVGSSATQELVVYSKEAHHREVLAMQEKALDELVHILGDNLEGDVTFQSDPKLYASLLTLTSKIVDRARSANELLKDTVEEIRTDPLGREAVALAFDRARRELARSARTKRRFLSDAERAFTRTHAPDRIKTDRLGQSQARMVRGLEKNVVYLADLLNDQRMIDAEALMKELREQQQALRDALEEYKNAPTDEKRKVLEQAIREIKERMKEIGAELAKMKGNIPSEYVNPDALANQDSMANLDRVQKMVEEGNLDAAMKELDQMLNSTEKMIAQMQDGRQELGSREYGEITQMADQLWKDLEALTEEQKAVAERTEQISQQTLERMKDRLGDSKAFVEKQMQRLQEAAALIERAEPAAHMNEGDVFDQLLRRMDDTGRALQSEDFGSAQEMVEKSLQHMRQLQDEMDRRAENAKRFGDWFGNELALEKAMRDLKRAAPKLEAVAKDIDDLMPNPDELLKPNERRELDRLSQKQSELEQKAQGLGKQLDQLGQKLPIVGDGTKQHLRDAQGAMKNAEQGMKKGNAPGASGDHRRAMDSLDALKQSLEQMNQQGQQGGSGQGVPLPFGGSQGESGREDGRGRMNPREKVEIPKPEQYQAPAEFREDILDAAKKGTAESYKDAVRRYYEEIVK